MAEHWGPGGAQGQLWKEAGPAEPCSSPGSPWSVSKASDGSGGDPANGASWAILAARAAQQPPWPPQGGLEGGSWAPGVAEAGGGGSSARSAGGSSRAASPTFADTARLQAVVQHQQQQLEAAGYRREGCTYGLEWHELGVLCRLHHLPPSRHACPPSSFVRMPCPTDSYTSAVGTGLPPSPHHTQLPAHLHHVGLGRRRTAWCGWSSWPFSWPAIRRCCR